MKLDDSIGLIETCQSIDELKRALQKVSEGYGFASFNFLDIGAPHVDLPFHIGSMKQQFATDYFGNKLIHVDPCISFARRMNTPFVWGDVPFPEYKGVRKSGAQMTIEVAGDHGYREGFIVPFHFSDRLGRVGSSLVVFFWADRVQRFQFLIATKKHEMHLIMVYWAQRMLDLIWQEQKSKHGFSAKPFADGDETLTDRERDVLSWAARGKTALDTADILVLAEETVNTHIRNAVRKLGANNKTHAVTLAIYRGLIDV